MLDTLNEQKVRNLILYIADRIIENKAYLTEVDSAIGDGDHGIGMALGMQKAKDKVAAAADCGNAYALFGLAGKTMLMSMGGASGVLFGSLFLGGAKDAGPAPALTAEDLYRMMEKSLAVIQERGKARLGDKTMVDALEPAVRAMGLTWDQGLLPMLQAAEKAAAQGVEDTQQYQAFRGLPGRGGHLGLDHHTVHAGVCGTAGERLGKGIHITILDKPKWRKLT